MKRHFLIGLAAVVAGACAQAPAKKESQGRSAAPAETTAAVDAEPSVRDAASRAIAELVSVEFPYDSDALDARARAALASNAAWLKQHPAVRAQSAGHCDQRGTVEYNLALGQRRAAAVRSYYMHLGVAGNRIATISYGKEHPLCQDPAEACWSRNRRVETLEVLSQNVSAARSTR